MNRRLNAQMRVKMRLDRRLKRKFLLIIIAVLSLCSIYFYTQNVYENKYFEEWRMLRLSLNGTNECRLPLSANPFDESVSRYIVKLPDRIECHFKTDEPNYYSFGPNGESLTFVDSYGVLVTIETKQKINCVYKNFSRSNLNDDQLQYSSEQPLIQPLDMKSLNIEFVFVKCFENDNLVYTNSHFYPSLVKKRHPEPNKPPIIILVIESLSRLNYLRFLKQTRQSFESLGNYFYLKGLTKYADNSFPNMAAMLTGLRPYYNEFPADVDSSSGPYDGLPLIWKQFSKLNYPTAFIEENPEFTLFNFLGKGFINKPTDWYPRPFWLHTYKESITKILNFCYKNKPRIELFLEQVKQFIEITKPNAAFLYAFLIEITHSDFNKAQLVDSHFAKFIQQYKTYLNDSIFILMGDHGNRYGSYLETALGRIEERMPLFAMHLPESMLRDMPHLKKYLDINSERLTSWLDVHQILVDIAESNFTEFRSGQRKRKYSFWREEIPVDRTCDEALIPENYCVCDQRIEVNVTENFVIDAAHSLITHLNHLLSPRTKQCAPLTLDRIKSAWLLFSSDVIQRSKRSERRIEITISAKPSNAIFNGLLYKNYWTTNWVVRGDVSRLNQYGNQSECIDNKVLKKFCFCEN